MHAHRPHRFLRLFLFTIISLSLIGCVGGKDFTPEDFKKIESGMTESKVREVLGGPKDSFKIEQEKILFWSVGEKYYSVVFEDDKVIEHNGPFGKDEFEMQIGVMKMVEQFKP